MQCKKCGVEVNDLYFFNDEKECGLCEACNKERLEESLIAGLAYWNQSLIYDEEYHQGAKEMVRQIIDSISSEKDVIDIAKEVKNQLDEKIKLYLSFYSRDELLAVCFWQNRALDQACP